MPATEIYRAPVVYPSTPNLGGVVYGTAGGGLAVTAQGTSGQVLQSNGAAAPTWVSPGGGIGTVTSVALTMPTGLTVAGSPVTSAGTLAVSLTAGYMLPNGGSSGQVLTSNGGSAPTFQALPAVTRLTPTAFASLPTPAQGMVAAVSDSTTDVWGDVIAGSGALKVLAYYNGTAWTVAAK